MRSFGIVVIVLLRVRGSSLPLRSRSATTLISMVSFSFFPATTESVAGIARDRGGRVDDEDLVETRNAVRL